MQGKYEKWAEIINKKYGEGTVTLELKDQYYNMREKIEPVMHIIDSLSRLWKRRA